MARFYDSLAYPLVSTLDGFEIFTIYKDGVTNTTTIQDIIDQTLTEVVIPAPFDQDLNTFNSVEFAGIGIGEDTPQTLLHITDGAGTTGTPEAGTSLTIEKSSNPGICLLGNNSGDIYFNDSDGLAGWVQYVHSTDMLRIGTSVQNRVQIDNTGGSTLDVVATNASTRLNQTTTTTSSSQNFRVSSVNRIGGTNVGAIHYNQYKGYSSTDVPITYVTETIQVNDNTSGSEDSKWAINTYGAGSSQETLSCFNGEKVYIRGDLRLITDLNDMLTLNYTNTTQGVSWSNGIKAITQPSAATVLDANLFTVSVSGSKDVSNTSGQGGYIYARASELWTPTSTPMYWQFNTTASGQTTSEERMRIDENGLDIPAGHEYRVDGVAIVLGAPRSVSNIVATGAEGGVFLQPVTTTDINNIDVWVNGIKLVRTTEFTSDGTNITITNPTIIANDDIEIITWE